MKKYIALTVLPLGVLVALIYYYAVDLPIWDEWEIITLLDKFYSGTLTFRDIFARHNEHRIILAKLIMLGNAVFFHWNIYIEFAINVLFAIGTSIIIFLMIENMNNITSFKKAAIYFASTCLIFSFSQVENWLWGFQMQILMCAFFAVLSAFLLSKQTPSFTFYAVFSGIATTFSFANGMMIWPAGLIVLCVSTYLSKEKNYGKIILWLLFGIFSIILYFYDFNQYAHISDKILYLIAHPHIFIILFASYLGAPVSGNRQAIALGAGLLGIIIQVYCLMLIIRHKRWNDNLFWICIDIFTILSSAITSLGRSEVISATMTFRYISFSMIFWICTIVISAYAFELVNHNIPVRMYLFFACIIITLSLNEHYMIFARERNEILNVFKEQMHRGEYDDRIFLKYIYPSRDGAKRINLLRKYGIRHFENAPVIEEFRDFTEIELETDALIHGNSDFQFESFELHNDNFFSLKVWHKLKAKECYIILYGKDKAFIAEMHKLEESRRLTMKKYQNAYEFYTRNNFTADWLYYGNLPDGTYNIAIKINDEYFAVEDITIKK